MLVGSYTKRSIRLLETQVSARNLYTLAIALVTIATNVLDGGTAALRGPVTSSLMADSAKSAPFAGGAQLSVGLENLCGCPTGVGRRERGRDKGRVGHHRLYGTARNGGEA